MTYFPQKGVRLLNEETSYMLQFQQADLTALTFGKTKNLKGQNLQHYHDLLEAACICLL